jgi:hypothetical protein
MHSAASPDGKIKLDPSYHSFESCFCMEGYHEQKSYQDDVLVAIACLQPQVRRLQVLMIVRNVLGYPGLVARASMVVVLSLKQEYVVCVLLVMAVKATETM